jgi:hypothetical protein
LILTQVFLSFIYSKQVFPESFPSFGNAGSPFTHPEFPDSKMPKKLKETISGRTGFQRLPQLAG